MWENKNLEIWLFWSVSLVEKNKVQGERTTQTGGVSNNSNSSCISSSITVTVVFVWAELQNKLSTTV